MSARLDTSELAAFGARISGAAMRVGAPASAALRRTAYAIEADAQVGAPVDTGALQNSISTSFEGDGRFGSMTAEIGPTVDYGLWVEVGTSRMAGQPYMVPAFDRQVPAYSSALADIAAAAF